jgi:predicted RecA/RadA family phage recombinase
MTNATYLQRGEALDYTNATDEVIPAGVIVTIGSRIGVTGCPIPPAKVGSLHVCGVFEIAKTGTAEIAMGQTVYFDGTGITDAADNGAEKDPASNTVAGYAAAPAAAADTTVLVQING